MCKFLMQILIYFVMFKIVIHACYRRSKAFDSLCLLLYTVMPSLNKISYLILSYLRSRSRTLTLYFRKFTALASSLCRDMNLITLSLVYVNVHACPCLYCLALFFNTNIR